MSDASIMLTSYRKNGLINVKTVPNECQMWKTLKKSFQEDDTIDHIVVTKDGKVLKDLRYVQTKSGMQMKNSVVENVKQSVDVVSAVGNAPEPKKKGCIFIVQ